jgi:uncharacterized coiled-coil DUF342 family protein
MKIRLTETQLQKAKLITEGKQRIDIYLNKADDIKEKVNRLYSKITYTTLAELLEGESDLSVYLNKLERWRTVLYTHYRRADEFFQNMSDDEYHDKFEDLHTKVNDTHQEVEYQKIDVLEDLIEKLKDFAESDVEDKFKDIKKMDI